MKIVAEDDRIYHTVNELHLALVKYAVQALRQAVKIELSEHPLRRTNEEVESFEKTFEGEAFERFAQVAGYLWWEKDVAEEAREKEAVVDGKPLTPFEQTMYATLIADVYLQGGTVEAARLAYQRAEGAIRHLRIARNSERVR